MLRRKERSRACFRGASVRRTILRTIPAGQPTRGEQQDRACCSSAAGLRSNGTIRSIDPDQLAPALNQRVMLSNRHLDGQDQSARPSCSRAIWGQRVQGSTRGGSGEACGHWREKGRETAH
ncbi:hypothetical protein M514_12948 [Trichuris suis]|uniref:Uncharacterized protein n=1 Tax=Trichuris suis TaxID=68888 RepID=A0A085LMH8_9BILA|nr:hypothetical protein M513_12948 [Trichuris suis]KFD64584.1 hypothetical protein M514_12948 [Trichuris suis]